LHQQKYVYRLEVILQTSLHLIQAMHVKVAERSESKSVHTITKWERKMQQSACMKSSRIGLNHHSWVRQAVLQCPQ